MSNPYVNKTFSDGDKELYLPYWRQVLQKEVTNFKEIDLEKEREKKMEILEDEISLKHPNTGSVLKLLDDGSIEMYVNEDTGIRMDPKENAIVFYGDVIHMATKETRIHTKPYNLIWNNHNFNPYLYSGDKVNDKRYIPQTWVKYGTKTTIGEKDQLTYKEKFIPIFQEQTRKTYYDKETKQLLEEIGIKFPDEER